MLQSCLFVNTASWGLIQLVCKAFMVCHGSFLSSCGEKRQVGILIQISQDVVRPLGEMKRTQHFCGLFFWIYVPDSRLLQLTLESVIGSALVEHSHYGRM